VAAGEGFAELLPSLAIGEAAVTMLSESGVPTPVVHTRLRAPRSRMAPAEDAIGDFLTSRQGKALQRQVLRGVFGMLRKRL
jgi:hypothetical protein